MIFIFVLYFCIISTIVNLLFVSMYEINIVFILLRKNFYLCILIWSVIWNNQFIWCYVSKTIKRTFDMQVIFTWPYIYSFVPYLENHCFVVPFFWLHLWISVYLLEIGYLVSTVGDGIDFKFKCFMKHAHRKMDWCVITLKQS